MSPRIRPSIGPDTNDFHELRTLILKSLCEPLSDSEIDKLNILMHSDGGAVEAAALIDQLCAFTDSGNLDSMAMAEVLSEALADKNTIGTVASLTAPIAVQSYGQGDSTGRSVGGWLKSPWLLALVASHLMIASLVWSGAKQWMAQSPPEDIRLPVVSPQLVSMTACVWSPSSQSDPAIGSLIQQGENLELMEGIAEIRIGEGTSGEALVRVEGPAGIFIRSDGQLELRHGILTAKSLGTGSGNLMVDGPIGEVSIDGQSSIGLVSNGMQSELHVFSGRALVKPLAMATSRELCLVDGEAVRFSPQSNGDNLAIMFEASLSSFVSARSSAFDPLSLNKKYAKAVLDSKPSIYWRFEGISGEPPYHVVNEGSAANMDAALIGEPGWRQYGENQVCELGRLGSSSGFRSTGLWPTESLDQYTVEMWIKPGLYHHGELLCMHEKVQEEDGRYPHSVILETLAQHWKNDLEGLRPNALRFVHRSPASGVVLEGSNVVANRPYKVRVWQHVAAVKKGEQISVWLDGRLVAEHSDVSVLNSNMQIVIGQLYLSRAERRFVGQIDEVAIYDRSLSAKELRSHIRAAGRPVDLDDLGMTSDD
ncbi:MAG: LamG domain-containing protein [Rubripirellula sp.]